MANQDNIKSIIENHVRRLYKLKEHKALTGRSVDPAILIEIEDIEAKIRNLRKQSEGSSPRTNLAEADIYKENQMVTAPCILVVEDEPTILEMLCLTLRVVGYYALSANNGIEALDVLERESVDLILSDISMPRMGGYQLYYRVCNNPQWVTIPFIFLTAHDLDSDVYHSKELGIDDYLTKPISPENLLSVVQGKLRRLAAIKKLKAIT